MSKSKKKGKYSNTQFSKIQHHKRVGKNLITPLNAIDKMHRSSWRDDHAPELLWAFLLTASISRADYLTVFRRVAVWAKETFPKKPKSNDESGSSDAVEAPGGMVDAPCEVDQTSISNYTDEQFKALLDILLAHPVGYGALRPLLLVDSIPGIERWRTVLGVDPVNQDWYTLADGIAHSFDHQSEQSTDIAKLAFLKLEEAVGDAPSFVDPETLQEIANEDVWHEFVNINLGHWANLNLRDLSIEGDTKEIYDKYYDWTSNYSHGQWGAIRDSNFITCHNPLHRLHRIPRLAHRLMPSVVPDGIQLTNKVLDLLEQAYPGAEKVNRVVVKQPHGSSQKSSEKEGRRSKS